MLVLLVLFIAIFTLYVYNIKDLKPPIVNDTKVEKLIVSQTDTGLAFINNNYLYQNKYGHYEMYLEGEDFDRGVIYGKLAKNLISLQEKAFTDEIKKMIPSTSYLKFLKYIIRFMNRNLPQYITDEYQREIYGISLSADSIYQWIGSNYSRQLNYHAAHDIGHALANMMLVGCTSFATWNQYSKDSALIVGRNFDFYVGDDFAKNKIIAFYKPTKGIPFASVTWGGFAGVVSGMNTAGLTVTINANKSDIPVGSATPVSLVAREILQYASTTDEAIAIARKREMFVSESFLVASAKDHKAIIIEKTPYELAVYQGNENKILCTNHYQSNVLSNQTMNIEQKTNSASVYRYERLSELLNNTKENTPQLTATILRDYKGKNNIDIGITNEKAVNQFICHHSIIFEPEKKRMWVSTHPWQMGTYVCYNIGTLDTHKPYERFLEEDKNILPQKNDSIATAQAIQYRKYKKEIATNSSIDIHSFIETNPLYYDTYRIAGDYYAKKNNKDSAAWMYAQALKLEIATIEEKKAIQQKLINLKK